VRRNEFTVTGPDGRRVTLPPPLSTAVFVAPKVGVFRVLRKILSTLAHTHPKEGRLSMDITPSSNEERVLLSKRSKNIISLSSSLNA
jgi:hypothetical protein